MKIFKGVFCAVIVMFFAITISGCYNGVLCYANNSITQTNNIKVKVKDNSKKAFIYGIDSNKRIEKFGKFGELTNINVHIYGETSLNQLKNTTTAINGKGELVGNGENCLYYTDFIEVKIRLPKDAEKVNTLNGKGIEKINKEKQVEDGYFKLNIEWVRLDKNKTSANLVVDENENDRYMYFEFLDKKNKKLEEYFLQITFNVKIKNQ